ncbi:MAG: hypothetical protein VYB54_00340 [Pseudomonadota bacterium]|nr:hypothetical protein [Pseudomonadota bacterium]
MGRILSESAIAAFGRDGITVPLRAFAPETAAAFARQMAASLPPGALDADPAGRLSLHLHFTWALELVRHPRILDAVADLVGPNLLCAGASPDPGGTWSTRVRRPTPTSPAGETVLCRVAFSELALRSIGGTTVRLAPGSFVLAAPWAGLQPVAGTAVTGIVARYITPHSRPVIAVDQALLVRGIDQTGKFALAAEPVVDALPGLLAARRGRRGAALHED